MKSLPQTHNSFWVRSRKPARMLVEQDRSAGGVGWMMTAEYRRCRNCHRVLLGPEAADYREKQRAPIEKWDTRKGLDAASNVASRRAQVRP